jgi:signal transduction histidine kinase
MSDINLEITKKLSDQILNLENILTDLSNIIEVKREQNIKKEWLNLTEFLDKTRLLLQAEIDITHTVIDDAEIHINEIYAAPAFLQSILYNLLHNAIKYAHPNRNPYIRIWSSKENQSFILQISDNGLGIDMKYAQDKIFGLYQRFHQHHKGKGMGLYLVRQQVEAMGGKIEVDSQPEEGTTFQIKLPNK